jgi:pimeloyl-ACP methyl ester carboxylesterase
MSFTTGSFEHDGHRLVYDDYGRGDRVVVYVHGILLDAEVNRTVAAGLADQGFRVVLLDLLGHGRSDRPPYASAHRMDRYAEQVIGLLDHLGVADAVLGGVSLGANVSLFAAAAHPDRVRGVIAEMPVLENATPAAAMAFVPMLLVAHYGHRPVGALAQLVRRVPRTPFTPLNSVLNAVSSPPESLAAVLHGIIVGPVAPTREARAGLRPPVLVLGHSYDPVHAFSDADALADLAPRARLVPTRSFLELRLFPRRLMRILGAFLTDCFDGAPAAMPAPADVTGAGDASEPTAA